MIKHISTLMLMLAITLSSAGQQKSKYEIFKAIGQVTYSSTNAPAKQGDNVKPTDRLILPESSKIGILDNDLHRVYYATGPCTRTVAAIVREAKRTADNAVASVNAEAFNKIGDSSSSSRSKVMGVSYRGNESENARLESIVNALLYISCIDTDSRLALATSPGDEEGTFCFIMTNDTESMLYANVIAVTPGKSPRLCINVGMTDQQPFIALSPGTQLTLTDFVFADYSPVEYYMFATSEPADAQALSLLLSTNRQPNGDKDTSIIVAPKISR